MTVEARDAFLEAALPSVVFEGWSDPLMADTATRQNLSTAAVQDLFPQGPLSLVVHFFDWVNRQVTSTVTREELTSLKIKPRMALLIQTRLRILEPHRESFRQALAFLALPPRGGAAGKALYDTADHLWVLAGDTATDFNFYTKRALLAGVVSSADLYWLADTSPAHADTTAFVGRQLDRVLSLGKKISQLKEKMGNRRSDP